MSAIYNQTKNSMLIENSGTIAGDVVAVSTGSFTIAGGSDSSHYGVMTGKNLTTESGNIGTITHTKDDLHFTSGYLLLNDNINAGSYSVI
ncbi:hypothetical protein TMES_21085, partial [Thalassospira mesophila]